MIPDDGDYSSFLMGSPGISTDELERAGSTVVGVWGDNRGVLVSGSNLDAYRDLVREGLIPGFWNEVVGRAEILFLFKLQDGTVKELVYSGATRSEIARLCSALNGDPLEITSDIAQYMAGNEFYRELMVECHGAIEPSL